MSNTQNLLYEDCPYTNFPAAADQFDRKADVDLTTKALVDQYYQYLGSNNFTAANELRQSNPGLKRVVISAEDINKLRDGMIAAQRLFLSDINEYLVRFSKPKGTWNKSTRYQKYNVVTYEDDTHAVQTYVAMPASETSLDIPIGAVPTDTNYWQRITLKGDKGDSGTGLTPRGLYRADIQYYMNNPNRFPKSQLSSSPSHCVSPRNHPIYNPLLLRRSPLQIDSGRFHALMPHQICQQSQIIIFVQKVLGESVTEGVRINHLRIELILDGITLDLLGHSAGADGSAETVYKQKPRIPAFRLYPLHSLCPQASRNINSPELSALGVEIHVTFQHMLCFKPDQFTHPCPGSCHKPDCKIPLLILHGFKLSLQIPVIRVADHILQEIFLLNFHTTKLQLTFI